MKITLLQEAIMTKTGRFLIFVPNVSHDVLPRDDINILIEEQKLFPLCFVDIQHFFGWWCIQCFIFILACSNKSIFANKCILMTHQSFCMEPQFKCSEVYTIKNESNTCLFYAKLSQKAVCHQWSILRFAAMCLITIIFFMATRSKLKPISEY